MDTGIGATLRDARSRRGIDLSEVEAAIKIRVRYLRAIENEEWDALPGGAYTRGFIRTYASYLGLDGDRLADDYRRATEPGGGQRVPRRVEPVPTAIRDGGRSPWRGRALIAVVCLALVGVLVGIAIAGGGGDDSQSGPQPVQGGDGGDGSAPREAKSAAPAPKPGVALALAAKAEVWVCLLDAEGEALLDGQILAAGEGAGPYRSKGFELALGNGSVAMTVDGEPAAVEESSSPVGYAIDAKGAVTALAEGERPDCE